MKNNMRPKERIPIFIQNISWIYLCKRWNIFKESKNGCELEELISKDIIDHWNKYPDQRFGQLLINLGLIHDNMRIWLDEEEDILKDQYQTSIVKGIEPREFLFWGSIYNKDGNLRDEIKYTLIKDLDTEHIEKILKMFENSRSKLLPLYEETFNKELKLRNEKTTE